MCLQGMPIRRGEQEQVAFCVGELIVVDHVDTATVEYVDQLEIMMSVQGAVFRDIVLNDKVEIDG